MKGYTVRYIFVRILYQKSLLKSARKFDGLNDGKHSGECILYRLISRVRNL